MDPRHAALAEEWRRLREALLTAHPDLVDDEDTLSDTLDGITGAQDAIRALIRGARRDEASSKALEALIREYAARGAALDRRAARRRETALRLMEAAGIPKVQAPEFTVSTRSVPPRVDIYEEEAIPQEFWTTVPKLDREKLREAVKAGKEVPGARLTNGSTCLFVRVA